ncbi:MAG TPA: peptidase domain-containing ABC transporter [Candidatus Binataceae bacterium]|nr:peptidase domain-containing ABC transporter [Candidatus Binataceae bacterium]
MITGLYCLAAVARHHGIDVNADNLARAHAPLEAEPLAALMVRMAVANGLRARSARLTWDEITKAGEAYPLLARRRDGSWLIVSGFRSGANGEDTLVVIDPQSDRQNFQFIARAPWCEHWDGEVVLVKRSYRLGDTERPFGLGWFVAEMWRVRPLLRDVAIAAVVLNLLGLAIPLFFQVVVDKVLVHQAYATLYVLTAGVVAAAVFEAVFGFLRRYLILHVSNKIDIRLATRTFAHLMRLPLDFFENIPAGVLVKHMQQAEKIREFLAGRLFLTLVDGTSLLVFVPVLLLYSVRLTAIVLVFALLVAATILMLVRPFRSRLQQLYELEARRQSLLVEAIHGIHTVKSLALETQQRRTWDSWSVESLTMRYRVGLVSTMAQTAIVSIEKLMIIAVVAAGTLLVFNDAITVGALVAFQMLAGRVSGPLGQIVGLVHEYQDTALSVRMLATVMNARPERSGARGMEPPIRGAIQFDDVTFRYRPDAEPALNGVSFTVPAGKILGVVGHSGSGKTTLTRLIQGISQAQGGVIRVDGIDVRNIDVTHLRSRIGVVLQDNFLFRGTVRENIAAPHRGASFEEIVAVASLAGADEFIERLPQGFDTPLEENASNLSGGQRQRLAIARALIMRPAVLILDEATSALDPDSEAIIQANLRRIAAGRTVIIVSHRLGTLADADAILVLERGRKIGFGRHVELMAACPLYANLWRQQTRHFA